MMIIEEPDSIVKNRETPAALADSGSTLPIHFVFSGCTQPGFVGTRHPLANSKVDSVLAPVAGPGGQVQGIRSYLKWL